MSSNTDKPAVRLVETSERAPSRFRRCVNWLFGRPLAAREAHKSQLGPITGVPALGLDALASASYGPEAALTLLLVLGSAGPRHIGPIVAVIVVLAFIVYFSYRQTIAAYPSGGGSYTVAKENLRPKAGLLAAAALACDYVLNVAVGISAGAGALVSAFPALAPYLLPLCLGLLGLLVLVNLRGARDAGIAWALPTYSFVAALGTLMVVGIVRTLSSDGAPTPLVPTRSLPEPVETLSFLLVLRAFASGCTAMTGIEAVSNGVAAFREPRVKNAQRTLTIIVLVLTALLGGVAFLSRAYGIGATVPGSPEYESVLSQLTGAVFGRGTLYYMTMATVVMVLCLSANTSFVDFPRLCAILAQDRYLPSFFAARGRRLAFSIGVLALALFSGALLVVFDGVTDRLIPLFAVGAFFAFTLSQAGMVAHWRRTRTPGFRRSLAVNLVGATATGATCLVVAVSKFGEGAWIIVLALPLIAFSFLRIHRHYERAARELADDAPLDLTGLREPVVIVPLEAWNKLTSRALRFALTISRDVHALHVLTDDTLICELTPIWEDFVATPARAAGLPVPELVLRRTKYREFFGPLVDYVATLRDRHPGREVVVVVPSVVPRRFREAWLHNERSALLKALLRQRSGSRVVVVSMPHHLRR